MTAVDDRPVLPTPLGKLEQPGELYGFALKVFGGDSPDSLVVVLEQLPADPKAVGPRHWGAPLRDVEEGLARQVRQIFDGNLTILLWSRGPESGSWRLLDVERPDAKSFEDPVVTATEVDSSTVDLLLSAHDAPQRPHDRTAGFRAPGGPRTGGSPPARAAPKPAFLGRGLPESPGIQHASPLNLCSVEIKVFNPTPDSTVVVIEQVPFKDGSTGVPLRFMEANLAVGIKRLFKDPTILEWVVDKGVGRWRQLEVTLHDTPIPGRKAVEASGSDISEDLVAVLLGDAGPPAVTSSGTRRVAGLSQDAQVSATPRESLSPRGQPLAGVGV